MFYVLIVSISQSKGTSAHNWYPIIYTKNPAVQTEVIYRQQCPRIQKLSVSFRQNKTKSNQITVETNGISVTSIYSPLCHEIFTEKPQINLNNPFCLAVICGFVVENLQRRNGAHWLLLLTMRLFWLHIKPTGTEGRREMDNTNERDTKQMDGDGNVVLYGEQDDESETRNNESRATDKDDRDEDVDTDDKLLALETIPGHRIESHDSEGHIRLKPEVKTENAADISAEGAEEVKNLLGGLSKLPEDVIGQVLDLVSPGHIKDFFLYWPETRQLIINQYYHKELHCIVSPFQKQQHVCVDNSSGNDIYDLCYYGEIDDFLSLNPDIIPRKLMWVTGSDFYSLYELVVKYKDRITRCPLIEILLEFCKCSPEELKYLLSFANITRIQFAVFKFKRFKSVLNEALPQLSKLSTIQFLAHDVKDWSDYEFPPNLESLDCSWNNVTNPLTLSFNDNLKELYLNYSNIDDSSITALLSKIPLNLKVLMLTYNSLRNLDCSLFPDSIEKIDLLHNDIQTLLASGSHAWPRNLRELNLSFNPGMSFDDIATKSWPPNLKALTATEASTCDLYSLNNLPDSLKSLDLFGGDVQFRSNQNLIIPFRFPSQLRVLTFSGNERLIEEFQDSNDINNCIIFPPNLKKLSLFACRLNTLKYFKFPKTLTHLDLRGNGLAEYVDSYEFDNPNLEILA